MYGQRYKIQNKKFLQFLMEDDMGFYERYVRYLSDEEQRKFFAENPQFMKEYQIDEVRRILLKDKRYRQILKKIQMLSV